MRQELQDLQWENRDLWGELHISRSELATARSALEESQARLKERVREQNALIMELAQKEKLIKELTRCRRF